MRFIDSSGIVFDCATSFLGSVDLSADTLSADTPLVRRLEVPFSRSNLLAGTLASSALPTNALILGCHIDLDFATGTAKIDRTVWRRVVQEAAKAEVGTIKLDPPLVEALLRLQAKGVPSAFVLPIDKGGKLTHRAGSHLLRAIQEQAGVRRSGPHALRHSALTLAAKRGASGFELQALARHKHYKTTVDNYIHDLDKVLLSGKASARLGDLAIGNRTGNSGKRALKAA